MLWEGLAIAVLIFISWQLHFIGSILSKLAGASAKQRKVSKL
jgi:hypothetical protein